jgi:ABC-type iron transport system FetAB permease component
MKRSVMLTIASLLSILLLMLHVTDDIVRGMDKAGPANFIAIAILVVWLYGTLVLTERRPGYIITLIGGIIATGMPAIHLRGTGIVNVVKSSGGFFFLWTLFALGVLGIFSIILSARGLRNPQWGQSR